MTYWRRLRDRHDTGVWQRLHEVLLSMLRASGQLDMSRAVIDGSHVRTAFGRHLTVGTIVLTDRKAL
ncbi:hypothetical protein [Micromonospora sagamiensis]|uniref:Uncharacterized protein n=1 Tax=Micromonospora sagamiensis TaxID=47875 RepID=A0A562WLU9_9ACTN|nr:hypothetical protein JD81_04739 [Micromonospora sagamiensis]BCL15770.1 hypothetical protein GCM10017556_35090 [Micromonospora sagamiensis]